MLTTPYWIYNRIFLDPTKKKNDVVFFFFFGGGVLFFEEPISKHFFDKKNLQKFFYAFFPSVNFFLYISATFRPFCDSKFFESCQKWPKITKISIFLVKIISESFQCIANLPNRLVNCSNITIEHLRTYGDSLFEALGTVKSPESIVKNFQKRGLTWV